MQGSSSSRLVELELKVSALWSSEQKSSSVAPLVSPCLSDSDAWLLDSSLGLYSSSSASYLMLKSIKSRLSKEPMLLLGDEPWDVLNIE